MELSSESSCKFLGDAQPDPVQGHCPQAPHAEAQLPTRAATRPRTDLTCGTDGGNRAVSLPGTQVPALPHPRPQDTGTDGVSLLHPSSSFLFCI